MASVTLFSLDHGIMALQMKKREHKWTTAWEMQFKLQIYYLQALDMYSLAIIFRFRNLNKQNNILLPKSKEREKKIRKSVVLFLLVFLCY